MTDYTIGIDTGGTYTDAVIVDTSQTHIIATAKALTTKGDLSIGVTRALEAVLDTAGESFDRSTISMVCLSTTLATNALVEGHGSSVGVFLIGFDDAMAKRTQIAQAVPEAKIFRIDGGHIYTGDEQVPLAIESVLSALKGEAGSMEAYAIAAHYSVRNSSHEHRVQALIQEITTKPVTASCDLSDSLNGPRRALTATFNARIISSIVALEQAVERSLAQLDINASIMVVKGDGSIASADEVKLKPIETILSGPAASVMGARFLCGKSDFVIADIGGTTSDVAMVKNGWPTLNEQGSDIGGFHTLVRAIDMQTVGLGGDSEVLVEPSGIVQLGKNRLIPISLLASRWPWIEQQLAGALNGQRGMLRATQYVVLLEGHLNSSQLEALPQNDRQFIARLDANRPRQYHEAVACASDRTSLSRLIKLGLVQISGVTPSDAAHVTGRQSQWSCEAAKNGCELLGRAAGLIKGTDSDRQRHAFAQNIVDAVIAKSSHLMIEHLAGRAFEANDPLISAVTRHNGDLADLKVKLSPTIDIIAVGGPAAVFYPGVGKRLGTKVIIPENSAVANAIGAAMSMIKVRTQVEITYGTNGGYLIHFQDTPETVDEADQAIERASQLAREQALKQVKLMGGVNTDIEISVKRIDLPGLSDKNKLMAAMVIAEVVGAVHK